MYIHCILAFNLNRVQMIFLYFLKWIRFNFKDVEVGTVVGILWGGSKDLMQKISERVCDK
jgi:hypothetical protein